MFFSVFITNDNLGIGVITGSEIINIFGVMGAILYKGQEGSEPTMDRWFFLRNALYYMGGCGLFVASLQNSSLVWYMALILFLYGLIYLMVLWKSEQFRAKIFLWLGVIHEDDEFVAEEFMNMKRKTVTLEELIANGLINPEDSKLKVKLSQCKTELNSKDLSNYYY